MDFKDKKKRAVVKVKIAYDWVLAVTDFSQVHPRDNPKASGQPLQQQPYNGCSKKHP